MDDVCVLIAGDSQNAISRHLTDLFLRFFSRGIAGRLAMQKNRERKNALVRVGFLCIPHLSVTFFPSHRSAPSR